ncbi:hypothetical protein GUITHDRAFT_142263 [Guillardia theta CCMP2712]|uniref:Uncharacterized protein n=1 Tax=Guillardia theta (strain CCMP2712) TaxID=905079 RepID=L1IXZ1_GUITC|nr:hypothetical protein GUITHDRAFT_142263 [Guillardia theta CCMP2712]EKX41106.1 hypothetical protein GUITHDRAFT_142263 [Guillardia theta CCMP2712]|eukprot:XP_005828086.1 hypothetical protein GUITHDRAFT_142263 [Guillardia theta CCMP2712]
MADEIKVPLPRYQDSKALLEYAVRKMKEENIIEGVLKWQEKEVDAIIPPEAEEPPSSTRCFRGFSINILQESDLRQQLERIWNASSEEEAERVQMEEFKSLIYEDEHCVGLVPSNFRENKNISPNGINLSSFHKAKDRGLTSRYHLLMLPKARRYNACTLSKQDLELLKHMDTVGRRLLLALAAADSFPADGESNLDRPLTRAELKEISDKVKNNQLDLGTPFYLPGGGDLCPEAAEAQCSQVVTAFQVYPNHSVGWLHLHVFASIGLTRAGFGTFIIPFLLPCHELPS